MRYNIPFKRQKHDVVMKHYQHYHGGKQPSNATSNHNYAAYQPSDDNDNRYELLLDKYNYSKRLLFAPHIIAPPPPLPQITMPEPMSAKFNFKQLKQGIYILLYLFFV